MTVGWEGSKTHAGPIPVLVWGGCITGELVLSCFLFQWVLVYKLMSICKVCILLMFNCDTLVHYFSSALGTGSSSSPAGLDFFFSHLYELLSKMSWMTRISWTLLMQWSIFIDVSTMDFNKEKRLLLKPSVMLLLLIVWFQIKGFHKHLFFLQSFTLSTYSNFPELQTKYFSWDTAPGSSAAR